jgi:hypothetical protein
MNYVIGLITFIGALAFVFSLRSDTEGWFLFYTFVFALCAGTVVILI